MLVFSALVIREEMNDAGESNFFQSVVEVTSNDIDTAKSDLISVGFEVLEIKPKLTLV